jgi:hypothetical protein
MNHGTRLVPLLIAAALAAPLLALSADAEACGCFAPPLPSPGAAEFAVNQQAEQIIFEVDGSTVSAHVRIFYQGDPEEFAWLLPMPNVPDLELSNGLLFGLVDEQTAPQTGSQAENVCPQQQYTCRQHPPCPSPLQLRLPGPAGSPAVAQAGNGDSFASESVVDGAGQAAPPPVQVLAQERIGAYDTITFAADEANLAVDWLNENGFIINETMSPYMQPYLDAGMVFIASKLVPGADLDQIRPLKLTYQAESASIPLQLTAIAAEPHMMVTAFIYSNQEFTTLAEPLTDVPAEQISTFRRSNYPALLSRVIDEAGGNAFVKEYVGTGPVFTDPTGCCSQGDDWCFAGGDGICQCPEAEFDAADCGAQEELVEAATTARRLATEYSTLTRLTTRVSPDEMVFNPEFVPAREPEGAMRLRLFSTLYNATGCEALVVEQEALSDLTTASQRCSDLYCDYGECVSTTLGAGCLCNDGFVARTFTDSDGTPSMTCVPEVGTVDFAAGGIELPDACAGVSINHGECVDIGGFAAVACDEGLAAAIGPMIGGASSLPGCVEIEMRTGTPGAMNYTLDLPDFDICSRPPPICPANGWLEKYEVDRPGIDCGTAPDESWFEIPPAPDCSQPEPAMATMVNQPGMDAPSSSAAVNQPMLPVDTREPRPEAEGRADARSGDDPTRADADGGCAIATAGNAGFGATPTWLLAGLLVLRRRRRQGQTRTKRQAAA